MKNCRGVEPRRGAGRRDLGTPRGIIPKHIPPTKQVRSRTLQKSPPIQTKNFPQGHPPKQSETNFRNARAGALGGSSGRMREVWREKRRFCKAKSADSGFAALDSPPKGGSFSLQGLPYLIRASSKRSRKTLTERTERKAKRMAKASGKSVAISGVSAGLRR